MNKEDISQMVVQITTTNEPRILVQEIKDYDLKNQILVFLNSFSEEELSLYNAFLDLIVKKSNNV